ncbi:MAG: hypothetical protein IPN17_15655 [Deltaproteobacteria bacterium]|nr:hypothetical protein [Deltaproteobacteria bacterium]
MPLRDLAALRVALTHSRDAAHKIADLLATNVGAFFATPGIEAKRWGVVRALTRSHIEDLLARGSHRRDELFSSVAQRVGASGDDTLRAATAVLADLTNTPEPAGYLVTQDFTVPSSVLAAVSALSEDEAFLSFETGQVSEAVFVTPGNDAGTIQVSVELRARTAVQAKLRGIHYAREALCKLSFAASLSFEPSLDGSHWKIVGSEPRVALADGTQAVFQELTEEVPDLAVRPAAVGFVRAYPQNLSALVSRLPTLARIEAWAPVEAGSRLARTLHWLTIADQLDAQAAEKLAHAWTAVEHLVVAGTEAKGADVIRYLASVGAVERLLAIGGDTYRECLAALHINACLRPTDQTVIDALCESLGAAERSRYQGWTAGVVSPRSNLQPAADLLEISDRAGLSQLLRWGDRRLLAIAKAIAPGAPYAGRRLEEFALDIAMDGGRPKGLLRLLRSLYFEAAALLQHVYDLRNQLVHDADPFVYEGAHRMDDLHQRFRILVDPLVGRLICRAAAGSTDLAHMLALEASTYARLNLDLERCISGPAPIPYQVDRLLSYLPDW